VSAVVGAAQAGVLLYFAAINLIYSLFCYLGTRAVRVYSRELSDVALRDLLERDVYKPVSILVPAYNEAASIVGSLRSALQLHYPEFEVIVVNDGSSDATMAVLIEAFSLVVDERPQQHPVPCRPVRRVLRSVEHPHLIVVDKENGGKADALNCALNLARYPLVAAVDADSMLDAEAVLRAARSFVEDPQLIAAGGTIRPLNGCVLSRGRVAQLRMPRTWVERFQVLEYARAFFAGRAGWSAMRSLLIISGAFGLFRRDIVLEVGGWDAATVGEDMELVVRLQRHLVQQGREHRVLFTPDPVCWTEVPSDLGTLRRQRNRWQRGLVETLWKHRRVVGNPRYGRMGLLGMPYFVLFEAAAPVVEVFGYAVVVVSVLLGRLSPTFALLFVGLALLYGMLLSQIAAGIETLLLARYPRVRDRLLLLLAGLLEPLGYRQILAVERLLATFQVGRRRGAWGGMRRRGLRWT